MIIQDLTKNDIGRVVMYRHSNILDGSTSKMGRLKRWNGTFIFVVFNAADDWDNFMDYTAHACDPDKVSFI